MKHFPVSEGKKISRSILRELDTTAGILLKGDNSESVINDGISLAAATRAPVLVDLEALGVHGADKEVLLFPHFNDDGEIGGYNLLLRDRTEFSARGQHEGTPVKSLLPDYPYVASKDWLISVDADGRITFISSAGFSSNHFNGRYPAEILIPDVSEALDLLLAGKPASDLPFSIFANPTSTGIFIIISGINPFSHPEELYASSHQFINYVFDNIPTDIAIWTLDHKYLYANSLAIGNPEVRDWIIGKTDFDYCEMRGLPYSMAAERRNMFNRALASNAPHQWIETLETPEGEKHLLRVYDAIRNEQGRPVLMAGYALDITGRINSENAFQKIIRANDRASDGIALCNAAGEYYYMNQKHAEIFDYTNPHELIGKPWKFLYPEHEVRRLEEEALVRLKEDGHWTGVTYGRGKTGRTIVQEITLTTMEGGDLICICRDISERIRQGEELRKLAIVAKETLSSVVIMDTGFRIEWVNNTFLSRTGLTPDEVLGCRADQIFRDPVQREKVQKAFLKLQDGQPQSGELRFLNPQGGEIWVYASVAPVFNEMGELVNYISVDSDISIYKKAEEQLMKNLQTEKALGETKSRFVSLASHELRTPLMALQARLDIARIKSERGASADEIQAQFQFMQDEIDRVTEILDKVLIAGKLGKGSFTVNKVVFSPVKRLQEISDKLMMKEYADYTFDIEQRGDHSRTFGTDPSYFDHIFINLLSNAAKFSGHNKRIKVIINFTAQAVQIAVSDQGIGIPREELADIFDLFHRGSNAANIRGTGLGLYIVKHFVGLIGGTVSVDSALNKGTTFTINLPYT